MTTILAIDTSTGPCSVAIWHENQISAYIENAKPVMQSASLMPMIEEALKKTGLLYKDLNLVTATVGPGSFTGIRVGLAAARGIAFAANIPSVGYTTLEVLAYAARKHEKNILSILNAGKGEYYYHYFTSALKALAEPQVGSLEEAAKIPAPFIVSGNIALEGAESCGVAFPRADALASLAAEQAVASQCLRPYYIRPPDAKLPNKI